MSTVTLAPILTRYDFAVTWGMFPIAVVLGRSRRGGGGGEGGERVESGWREFKSVPVRHVDKVY